MSRRPPILVPKPGGDLYLKTRNRVIPLPVGGAERVLEDYRRAVQEGRPMFRVVDVTGEEILLSTDRFDRVETR